MRKVVPQNSHATKSDALIDFSGIVAPQLGQLSAFISYEIVYQNYLQDNMELRNFITTVLYTGADKIPAKTLARAE